MEDENSVPPPAFTRHLPRMQMGGAPETRRPAS
jgi:hypothetical protein